MAECPPDRRFLVLVDLFRLPCGFDLFRQCLYCLAQFLHFLAQLTQFQAWAARTGAESWLARCGTTKGPGTLPRRTATPRSLRTGTSPLLTCAPTLPGCIRASTTPLSAPTRSRLARAARPIRSVPTLARTRTGTAPCFRGPISPRRFIRARLRWLVGSIASRTQAATTRPAWPTVGRWPHALASALSHARSSPAGAWTEWRPRHVANPFAYLTHQVGGFLFVPCGARPSHALEQIPHLLHVGGPTPSIGTWWTVCFISIACFVAPIRSGLLCLVFVFFVVSRPVGLGQGELFRKRFCLSELGQERIGSIECQVVAWVRRCSGADRSARDHRPHRQKDVCQFHGLAPFPVKGSECPEMGGLCRIFVRNADRTCADHMNPGVNAGFRPSSK